MRKMPLAVILALLFCCSTNSLFAEQKILEGGADSRLPPALPGEEVSDGKKTMKLWSTSGPVPVAATPNQGEWSLPPVVIDNRNRYNQRDDDRRGYDQRDQPHERRPMRQKDK